MNADPEVMRYIGSGGALHPEPTPRPAPRRRPRTGTRTAGASSPPSRSRPASWSAGRRWRRPHFLPEILPATELGWRVRRDRWGRGYAPEAARAALGFAFGELGLDRVVSCIHSENTASIRVAEKLGMTLERETVVPIHEVPCSVYERKA